MCVCMYVCMYVQYVPIYKCEEHTLLLCLVCNAELCFISLAVLSRRNVTRPFEDATSLVSHFFLFLHVCVHNMFVYTCVHICVHKVD